MLASFMTDPSSCAWARLMGNAALNSVASVVPYLFIYYSPIKNSDNPESTKLYATTVTDGDPSWAGALAGEALGLPAYHITEPEIKEQIDAATYDLEVGLADIALDSEEIARAIKEVRGG